jgi:RDD family
MGDQSLDNEASGPQSRPWVRWAARMFDFYLFAFLVGVVLGLIDASAIDKIPDRVLGIILMAVYVFIEPLMLVSWGTTPGKALLKIRLRRQNEGMLSYSQALSRSFNVWIYGLGLGIPLVSLVTLCQSYQGLTQDGITRWDRQGNFSVSHDIIGPVRIAILVLVLGGFLALTVSSLIASKTP